MKTIFRYFLLALLLPLLTACPFPPEPLAYSAYVPILMSRSQLEASVAKKEPQTIVSPGKLYSYGNYILINEQYKGLHLINNQNPRAPQNIGFIQVPGCIDFAVKANVLYVDNAVDLVAIDLHNLNDLRVTKRIKNALPAPLSPDNLPSEPMANLPTDAIIVGWNLKEDK